VSESRASRVEVKHGLPWVARGGRSRPRTSDDGRGRVPLDGTRKSRPLTVTARVFLAVTIVAVAFTAVTSWGVVALRSAAQQTTLLQTGYFPLTRSLRELVTLQDTWNTQLNHVTLAQNPADTRLWFDTVLRIGRPRQLASVRAVIAQAFTQSREPSVRAVGSDVLGDVRRIERSMVNDQEQVRQLFDALAALDNSRAERLRDSLVKRGLGVHVRLVRLDQRVLASIEVLTDEALREQRFAVWLLLGLGLLTVCVGTLMLVYTRRVLAPLARLTERAREVAGGDRAPQAPLSSRDEIGELSMAFESMVAAIAAMESRLLSSERLVTIGKMAAHVTHEIRNPLSSMALNLELLEEEVGESSSATLVKAIVVEVERLSRLTAQYLSMARDVSHEFSVEDLVVVVRELMEFMKSELDARGVRPKLQLPPHRVPVLLDEGRLRQAMLNLVRNACEAMPNGGELTVEVVSPGASSVCLRVEDTGTGVDEHMRERLFEPFVTSKAGGTGLGLVITRQIVEQHHGTIECEPRQPSGTRFTLTFPKAPEANTPGVP